MIQINTKAPTLIQLIKYSIVAILSIVIFNWLNNCSSRPENSKTQTVIIPAKSGKFESKKPDSKPLEIKQEPLNQVKKDGVVYVSNPLNEKLLKENEKLRSDYLKMNDSLKSKAYEKAIELNSFSSKFEDQFMVLNINGTVRGEVQEITPSYTRKEFEIELKQKETVFRLLAGVKVQSGFVSPNLNIGGDLMFQNKRGDILSLGYSNKNLNESNKDVFSVGYYKSIFNIKR